MDIHRFVQLSNRLSFDDLDWDEAARVGLTDAEKSILAYFADIEGQTIFYLREVLKTRAAREPDVLAFVTLWNYEEFFHGYALTKLLDVCGAPASSDRVTQVRTSAQLAATLEDWLQTTLSRCLPQTFVALYMTWGASQEILTLRGYEHLAERTDNPVLRELCRRIALQERRHFAWYFNSAKQRLASSPLARRVVRELVDRLWTPVGMGVKSKEQVAEMVTNLFPGPLLLDVMRRNDSKLAELPGMEGLDVMERFATRMLSFLRSRAVSPAPGAERDRPGAPAGRRWPVASAEDDSALLRASVG